jgi:hypothetical protein
MRTLVTILEKGHANQQVADNVDHTADQDELEDDAHFVDEQITDVTGYHPKVL